MTAVSVLRRKRRWLRVSLVVLLLVGLAFGLVYRSSIDPYAIRDWLENLPLWEKAATFVFLHIVASLFFVPRFVMGIAAGMLFGDPVWGSVFSVVGGLAGAMAGFLLVRFVSAGAVKLKDAPAVGEWLQKAESQGWRLVLVVRLIPIIPHSLINYTFGLSKISTLSYALGSALGLIPTSIVYANLGASGRGLAEGTSDYAMLAVWCVGLIFVAWLLPKLVRRLFPDVVG